MPDDKKRKNLITPDGRRVAATEEEAKRLAIFGYREETFEENLDRSVEESNEKIFTTPGQKALTATEGLASGLSLGLLDPLMEDDRTRQRAARNPGTRIAGEITGAVLPALLTAGATAPESAAATGGRLIATGLRATPAGLAARAGEGIASSVGGIKGAALGYGVEGGIAGVGSALTQSTLTGDPLTAESVLAHAGVGALLGAGVGAAGEAVVAGSTKLGKRLSSAAPDEVLDVSVAGRTDDAISAFYKDLPKDKVAKKAAREVPIWETGSEEVPDLFKTSKEIRTAERVESKSVAADYRFMEDAEFSTLRNQISDFTKTVKQVDEDVEGTLADLAAKEKEYKRTLETNAKYLKEGIDKAKTEAAALEHPENTVAFPGYKNQKFASLDNMYKNLADTLATDDPVTALKKLEKLKQAASGFDELAPNAPYFATINVNKPLATQLRDTIKATQDALELKQAGLVLRNFPETAEEFFKMRSDKAERIFAAAQTLSSNKEFSGKMRAILADATYNRGIQWAGPPEQQLRGLWEAGQAFYKNADSVFGKTLKETTPTTANVTRYDVDSSGLRKYVDDLDTGEAQGKFAKLDEMPGSPSVDFKPKQFEHTKFSKSKYGDMDAEDFYDLQAAELKAFKTAFGQKDNPELLAKWKNWLDENQFVKIQKGGMEKEAEELSKVVQSGSLPENLVLYRGRGFPEKVSGPGDVISSEGFVATSLNRNKAERFQRSTQGYGDMLIISAPAGSKSAYVGGVDEEILFDRGTKFTVTKITPGKFGRDIEVSIQPGGSSTAIPSKPAVPKYDWPEVLGADEQIKVSGSASSGGQPRKSGGAHGFWHKAARLGTSRYGSALAKNAGLGIAGSAIAYEMGGNLAAGVMGGSFVAGIAGARAGIMSRLANAVAKYGPATGRTVTRLAPRIEPLAVRIDGTMDTETDRKDKRKLLKARMDELVAAGPSFKDATFLAVQPLMGEHPEFSNAVHQSATAAYDGLMSFMPRDPGLAHSRLKTLWKPTDVQVRQFEKALAVYHDPVGSAEAILATGAIDSVTVAALKKMYPSIYGEVQVAMMNRLADPVFLSSLSYGDQARLSVLLDMPLHSSFSSRSIAHTQAMYQTTKKPQNPSGSGAGNSGGRPAKMEPPTASQSLLQQ